MTRHNVRTLNARTPITCMLIGMSLFFCLLAAHTAAQNVRFDNPMTSLGLSVRQLGSANAIAQDGLGFIWIGAENALGRYDGVTLRLYQSSQDDPSSLPNNYIWDLAVDPQGQLWVATSAGLSIYRPDTDSFELISTVGGQPFLSETITALAIDKGTVYVGTTVGLNIIDVTTQTLTAFVPEAPVGTPDGYNVIHDIAISETGEVWVATALGGIARLNQATGRFQHFYHQTDNPDSISSNRVRRLLLDSQGRLWAGTYGGGINVYLPESQKFVRVTYPDEIGDDSNSAVMAILEDSQGDFWVSVDQQGLFRFDNELSLVQHFAPSNSLISNQARAIFEDVNNDLWVGIFPFGVRYADRSKDHIRTYQTDGSNTKTLSNNAILSLLQDSQGLIWVGTEGGLNVFNPETGKFTHYRSDAKNPDALAANAVLAIAEDDNGDLWVGTWSGGLHRLDRKTDKFQRYAPHANDPHSVGDTFILTLLVDSDGVLWVGTETAGLHRYRPDTDDFLRYQHDPSDPESLVSHYINAIIEDGEGRLWMTTHSGLKMFDKNTGQFRLFTHEPGNIESLSTSSIKSLFADSRGYIWAGGHDKGVNRLDPKTGKVTRINAQHGLPSATISSIQEDWNGHIWLATNDGLARIHPDTLKITLVNVEHGLIGGSYNRNASLVDSDGRLYFGSTEGITAFKPEDITVQQSIHPIRVTEFRILNQKVPIGGPGSPLQRSILISDTVELNHSDSMFSFDFVMLNYRNSHLNRYAYMLEGFDTNWNYVGQRNSATYTNLNPGRYVFRVKGKAPAEEWMESDHPITIDIAPPPWLSWWAYCVYTLLGVACLYAVYAIGRLKQTFYSYKVLSITDPLTKVYNRAGIAQVTKGLFSSRESKVGVSILLMDIDNFKSINDHYGHDAGDSVLIEIAEIIKSAVRHSDHFGRWGGEEFILLCPSSTAAGAKGLADNIRTAIASHTFKSATCSLNVTISIGVALVHSNESFQQALKRADTALYQAKSSGRNRAITADPE